MIRLIRVELFKLLHKKSIYIILGIMFIFCFLNNYLYYRDYDDNGFYKYDNSEDIDIEKKKVLRELNKYNYKNNSDLSSYVMYKTNYDLLVLKGNYDKNTWQYRKINDYMYDIIYNMNYNKYTDSNDYKYNIEYNNSISKLNSNDWKYFINKDKDKKEEELNNLINDRDNANDKIIIKELSDKISDLRDELDIINYRINNNISYDNTYLDSAINKYLEYKKSIKYYSNKGNLSRKDRIDYNKIKEEYYINKYIMDNKININKENNMAYQLRNILGDYEIFFVLLIIIVGSMIICDEFSKGTIKLLLIKPYSRCKILLSKYLACIILLILSVIFIIMLQVVIGGLLFGFSSIKIPVVVYNHILDKIVIYSVIKYMFIRIVFKLSLFILLITLVFLMGVIFNSNIIVFVIGIMVYILSSTINYIGIKYNIRVLRYLLMMNWNLDEYLFGNVREYLYVNFNFSLIICIIYYLIMIVMMIIIFNKKNIKNT